MAMGSRTITTGWPRRPADGAGGRSVLDSAPCRMISCQLRTEPEHADDHRSFRAQLAFSIGFVVARSRDLLRRILKEHVTDDAREMLGPR